MTDKFDAHAVASNIETFAKRTLDEHATHDDATAKSDAGGLANALAQVWGDKDKLTAVTAELKKMGGAWFSSDPNVEFVKDGNGDISGINFTPSNWDHTGKGTVETSKHGPIINVDAKTDPNDQGISAKTVLQSGHIHLGPIDIKIGN
ncbi:MAG TPA: hypothetical protein V6C81_22880 [Planktothrix sp.]|jgi:hypothetical protein